MSKQEHVSEQSKQLSFLLPTRQCGKVMFLFCVSVYRGGGVWFHVRGGGGLSDQIGVGVGVP